jgi:hypothetical protein
LPALGDIDDDGLPELFVEWNDLAALEHDLSPKRTAAVTLQQASAISLADLAPRSP